MEMCLFLSEMDSERSAMLTERSREEGNVVCGAATTARREGPVSFKDDEATLWARASLGLLAGSVRSRCVGVPTAAVRKIRVAYHVLPISHRSQSVERLVVRLPRACVAVKG